MADVSEYEVRCPRCNVTFPIGTKVCLHCGGATGPSSGARGRIRFGEAPHASTAPAAPDTARFELVQPARAVPIDGLPEEEEVPQRGGWIRGAGTLVWILLAIGISVARSCSEGG
jgi:hypothetical protein